MNEYRIDLLDQHFARNVLGLDELESFVTECDPEARFQQRYERRHVDAAECRETLRLLFELLFLRLVQHRHQRRDHLVLRHILWDFYAELAGVATQVLLFVLLQSALDAEQDVRIETGRVHRNLAQALLVRPILVAICHRSLRKLGG